MDSEVTPMPCSAVATAILTNDTLPRRTDEPIADSRRKGSRVAAGRSRHVTGTLQMCENKNAT
jgi:hypothetical protein